MNILVIGGGAREHALCWALRRSPLADRLLSVPGNAGIAAIAECADCDLSDHPAVVRFAYANDVALIVVGPEQPLADGLVDTLVAHGLSAFGPTRAAARIEASKRFTKELCERQGIPTAGWISPATQAEAEAHVARAPLPLVVKADGLAAGKGVVVAATREEALDAVRKLWGPAGLVIEECLVGEEASLFALVDGRTAIPFGSAQDHKRAGDGDTGPNTGGMGAYSPARVLTPELEARAMAEIIQPAVDGMADAGTPFRGFLYAGLMLTAEGPKLIEFNARLGDPEAQVLLPRLRSDLVPLLADACHGRLQPQTLDWSQGTALTVVLAAEGYPAAPRSGVVLTGLDEAEASGALVFHAGTRRDGQGRLASTGGRILSVTALGDKVSAAQANAYAALARIGAEGSFCRRDIGWREIERERSGS